jgi:hypothetical protein
MLEKNFAGNRTFCPYTVCPIGDGIYISYSTVLYSDACVVISGNQKQGSTLFIVCDTYRINGCSVTFFCQVKELEESLKFQKRENSRNIPVKYNR